MLAVRLCCLSDAVSSSVRADMSGVCGVLCVTGSPSAQLHPLYIEHSAHPLSVTVTPLEPVQLSVDDSLSSASTPSSSSTSVHRGINSLEWSVDMRLLATAGWDGRVRLFSVYASQATSDSPSANIQLSAVLRFHTAAVQSIAFSSSHTALPAAATGSPTGQLNESKAVMALFTYPQPSPASLSSFSRLSSLRLSARSLLSTADCRATLLATGADDHRIALYSLQPT